MKLDLGDLFAYASIGVAVVGALIRSSIDTGEAVILVAAVIAIAAVAFAIGDLRHR